MSDMNRRRFITTTAGALGAAWAAPHLAHAVSAPPPHAMQKRSLGATGIETTRLGIGTGTRAWNNNSAQIRRGDDTFVGTLVHGYERGIRFYDLADMYGSHQYMARAMAEGNMQREELCIMTKTVSKTAEDLRADLDRFRKETNTDYFDVVLLHCMTKADWNETLRPCMDVLAEAKEQGIVRTHGVSCHDWGAMLTAVDEPWVDVMLSRINPYGVKMDNTPEKVAELLAKGHAKGIGNFGMKINGEGQLADRLDLSLQFVLKLACVDAITIGFLNPEELDDTIARIERAAA